MPTITQTGIIQDINPLGNGKFRITLEDGSYPIVTINPATSVFNSGTVNSSQVLLDPYINIPNVTYSDSNALLNNATETTPSTIFYDLDYTQGSISPVNFDGVINGTATKAPIQDYNFFLRRSVIPRYSGSKSTSNDFNLPTINGGLGTLPNVEQDRAFFAYFNWVGGTSPEWGNGLEDRSALSVRYFINEDGNVFEPTNDNNNINLGICRQTFTEGETAVLSFDDESGTSSNFSNLIGEQTIFKSGKSITPIIYSQTQSISDTTPGGYTGSLEFVQGDQAESTVDDYRLTVFTDSQIITSTGTVSFLTPTLEGTEADFTSDVYSPDGSDPSSQNPSTTLNFKAYIKKEFTANASATFQFQKNSNGAGWVAFGPSATLDANVDDDITIQTSDTTSLDTDEYRLEIIAETHGGLGQFIEISADSYWKVTQTPPPSIGFVGPDTPGGTNYWTKLGVTTNQFRTNALTAVLGQKQKNIENDINGDPVGFFPIVNDFNIQIGDEIRFQGTETQTYKITNISVATNPSYAGALVYTVDRNITLNNTEMNWFLVRRYVDTPGQIIIEADKPAGGTSPGFFMPLYSTKGIEDNFDIIIQQLKTDQLI